MWISIVRRVRSQTEPNLIVLDPQPGNQVALNCLNELNEPKPYEREFYFLSLLFLILLIFFYCTYTARNSISEVNDDSFLNSKAK